MTRAQLCTFREVDRAVTAAGAPLRVRHAANSSGAWPLPEARLDLVRTGIAIFGDGRWPAGEAISRPAMRLVTEVAQLRTITEGTSVGDGAADVTDVPEVAVGDVAVLLGRASGGASISVAEYGAWTGLSEYEVTCGMSKRVPRTYVGESP